MTRVSTGIMGLDQILHGGLINQAAYLVRGAPGQGKTTLGLHFLCAAPKGEPTLFIGFQESENQLRDNAASVGLDMSTVNVLSLSPDEQFFTQQKGYDIFAAADVEQAPLAETVVAAVDKYTPKRVFVDSLTQLRFLSGDVFQYRKQVLSFLRFLKDRGATVVFSSECSDSLPDDDLQFIADGVISLQSDAMGAKIRVEKFRGSGFYSGEHQMRNNAIGIEVFPRPMPPGTNLSDDGFIQLGSGISAVDKMLCGGIETSTITMITGPSGIGKSTLAATFAAETAAQGRRVAIYLFEEETYTYLHRGKKLQIDMDTAQRDGNLSVEQIEPMRYLADEFTAKVRQQVQDENLELVIIDSTAGFQLTLDEEGIKDRLHALVKSLCRVGVSVLLINETETMTGNFLVSEKGISYLSDNVIFLRYMEIDGEMQRVIGVLKKRLSDFDQRLHTFQIGPKSLSVNEPIQGLSGVMAGAPTTHDDA